jgi:hypothetical protein
MIERHWLGVPRIALAVVVTLALLLVFPTNAYAYTDPGSGALLWQMMMAGLVGVMFYVHKTIAWIRKTRRARPPIPRD